MKRILALLALLGAGCSQKPVGVTLVFPSDADRLEAKSATIYVADAGPDCSQFLSGQTNPPNIRFQRELTFNMGVPSGGLKDIPTGNKLMLVKVQNQANILFLTGCRTGTITSDGRFDVVLGNPNPPDLAVSPDLFVPDLVVPPDLMPRKTLNLTVSELRNPTRKLQGVTVTVADSGSGTASATTDIMGKVAIDTATLTPPFRVTAVAPSTNGYQGFTSIAGITPTFTNDAVAFSVNIDLDPPLEEAGNTITATTLAASDVYWVSANGVPGDVKKTTTGGAGNATLQPLTLGASYRVAISQTGMNKVATHSGPVVSTGATYNPASGEYQTFATGFTGTISTGNVNYTNHAYAVNLVVPVSLTVLNFPLGSVATAANGAQSAIQVPAMASLVGVSGTKLQAEVVGTSTTARAELRFELNATSDASHTFSALPDPPTVTTPTAQPAAMPQTIMVSPPSAFPTSTSYVHVFMKDTADKIHGHILQPAIAGAASVVVPGGSLPAGDYTTSVAYVQPFPPANTSIPATLTDDWTKLIRKLPQQLSSSTITVTVQ